LKLSVWLIIFLIISLVGAAPEIKNSGVNVTMDSDFRNYFGIMWTGDACENLAYAKTMGYDYVMYQTSMEKCSATLKQNMHFYFEAPDADALSSAYTWQIDITKNYTQAQIVAYNLVFVWKGNATEDTPFPQNLATGWWFTNVTFRPIIDFQQQKLIDFAINHSLAKVQRLENKSIGWLFGGWSWDVPDLKGDWWTARQSGYTGTNWSCYGIPCNGKIVNLAYWNPDGVQSGALHAGVTQEYATYPDGFAAFHKQLYVATELVYSDFKLYYQPYNIYNDYIRLMQNRSDVLEFLPPNQVILCQESGDSLSNDIAFMTDSRIYASGLITKDYVCSDTCDTHNLTRNLAIVGNAAINGGWTSFFGRWGGTDGTPSYKRVYEVPDGLKLIRVIPNWDNIAKIPLLSRSWDFVNNIYWSPNSYADLNIIAARHPDTKEIFLVFLDNSESIGISGISEIWSTNGTFQKVVRADSDFSYNGVYLTLLDSANEGKGYVIKTQEPVLDSIPELPEPLEQVKPLQLGAPLVLSGGHYTQYDNKDLPDIFVDGLGTIVASVVNLMDLLILALVLSLIVALIAKMR
jgi:hypothetical protein